MFCRRMFCTLVVVCFVFPLNQALAVKHVAPKFDAASANYPKLKVHYSYNLAKSPSVAFADKIRIFLIVRDENILKHRDNLVAEVKVKNLADYTKTYVRYLPAKFQAERKDELNVATLDLANQSKTDHLISPGHVYRVFVNLHRKSDKYDDTSALGHVPLPYYVATSGESELEKARHEIVMRSFREFYYRRVRWRSGERFPMDCYAFYMWATGTRTVGARNGRTQLSALFGKLRPYNKGSQIAIIAQKSPIHGDYVRKPGHSLMLLTYDPKQKHVWTIEGNYNSTIEVVVRSVDSGWRVGHLVREHIRTALANRRATSSEARIKTAKSNEVKPQVAKSNLPKVPTPKPKATKPQTAKSDEAKKADVNQETERVVSSGRRRLLRRIR